MARIVSAQFVVLLYQFVLLNCLYQLFTREFLRNSYLNCELGNIISMCVSLLLPMSDNSCSRLLFSYFIVPTLSDFFLSYLLMEICSGTIFMNIWNILNHVDHCDM